MIEIRGIECLSCNEKAYVETTCTSEAQINELLSDATAKGWHGLPLNASGIWKGSVDNGILRDGVCPQCPR